ncbi:hypothetical protein ACFVAJ_19040 [Agromyces sp. NPDC057679]|uniref:hypothetical protein n=1 Tax=Agromyces sp. NPDC057679 TaxID=3346207 RepID=UPI00366EC4A8
MGNRLLAIDPPKCGCTECIVGEYRPFDEASAFELTLMLDGFLADHTGLPRQQIIARTDQLTAGSIPAR